MSRPLGTTTSWRRIVLIVESDPALSNILQRELGARFVVGAASIARALQILDSDGRIAALVSSCELQDGTASRLFALAQQKWPSVRRILCDERERLEQLSARSAVVLAEAVASDFSQLRRAVA